MTFHKPIGRSLADMTDSHARERIILRGLRMEMELAVERFVHLLDAIDSASEDIEDEQEDFDASSAGSLSVDHEPTLGSAELAWGCSADQTFWARGGTMDAEEEDGELEPDNDNEASLAATEDMNHDNAWRASDGRCGGYVDLEAEHDGCEPEEDEEHDGREAEEVA